MCGVSLAFCGVSVALVEHPLYPLTPQPCDISALSALKLCDVLVYIEICSLGPPSWLSQG